MSRSHAPDQQVFDIGFGFQGGVDSVENVEESAARLSLDDDDFGQEAVGCRVSRGISFADGSARPSGQGSVSAGGLFCFSVRSVGIFMSGPFARYMARRAGEGGGESRRFGVKWFGISGKYISASCDRAGSPALTVSDGICRCAYSHQAA
jgi:hypothetical protein